jgi:hypothetical protein
MVTASVLTAARCSGIGERRIGIAGRLAVEITDRRDPMRVVHALSDILRARILAIACGYEDADDLDHLRSDPTLKIADRITETATRVRIAFAAACPEGDLIRSIAWR